MRAALPRGEAACAAYNFSEVYIVPVAAADMQDILV